MLIGSNIGSEFATLPSAPWSMEPPRPPMSGGGGSLPQQSAMQLSPTGMLQKTIFFLLCVLLTVGNCIFVFVSIFNLKNSEIF